MRLDGRPEIDWRRLADGTLVYEKPFAALDGERFERIARGFGEHYDTQWLSPDSFSFARGEGYTRLERWDAFGYVDGGTVERLRNEELPALGDNIAVLPAGWKAIRFALNMRVILIFWAFLLLMARLFTGEGHVALWLGGFILIYALHVMLIMRSLDGKLATWMARKSWN
ncbi:hypothetical protein [Sphingobium boeckii]|uniref:Uncharacterized protein n=1 Tax=Sphingobium boeckii TaxID=1082345 RepID=A0A7W9AKC7_9SPHN|nr:hypothetical protein [Sphingobium boeckii]MBB5687091.1 hypothetical protein [Sphingobium boeckii]